MPCCQNLRVGSSLPPSRMEIIIEINGRRKPTMRKVVTLTNRKQRHMPSLLNSQAQGKKESAAVRKMHVLEEKRIAEEERSQKLKEKEEARYSAEVKRREEQARKKEEENARKTAAEKARYERNFRMERFCQRLSVSDDVKRRRLKSS